MAIREALARTRPGAHLHRRLSEPFARTCSRANLHGSLPGSALAAASLLLLLGCARGSQESASEWEGNEGGRPPAGSDSAAGSPPPDDATGSPPPDDATGSPPPNDAAIDADPADADKGVPSPLVCGSNGITCSTATPVCCQSTNGSGAPTYACAGSGACVGYPITCSSIGDCPGSASGDVCCHFRSNTTCAPATHCIPSKHGVIICGPIAPGGCPSGMSCTALSGSAYSGCQ